MRHCIILGTGSDIAQELRKRLEKDGWTVNGTSRSTVDLPRDRWDLLVVCQGTMEPIGKFMDCDPHEWARCIYVNAIEPLNAFRALYKTSKYDASVVFLSGPNPTKANPTYSAYAAAKALLREAAKTIQAEHTNIKVTMLRTGVVKTKFHQQTIRAGKKAANLERVTSIVAGEEPTTSHDEVYRMVMETLSQFPENEGT